jgi:hypothetical protein
MDGGDEEVKTKEEKCLRGGERPTVYKTDPKARISEAEVGAHSSAGTRKEKKAFSAGWRSGETPFQARLF